MSDYDEETRYFFQELDALIERIKSGKLNKLDFKRIPYLLELSMCLQEGREDKVEEVALRMEKDFGC